MAEVSAFRPQRACSKACSGFEGLCAFQSQLEATRTLDWEADLLQEENRILHLMLGDCPA